MDRKLSKQPLFQMIFRETDDDVLSYVVEAASDLRDETDYHSKNSCI